MFNSTVLDMVILLVFTYFISSVLVSSANEFIATALNFRANELIKSLNNLFFDPQWPAFVQNKILSSPYFESLKKNNDPKSQPSYLPAENFAKAIMESMRIGNQVLDMQSIQTALTTNNIGLPADLQETLLGFLDTSENKIDLFQRQIEQFYNNAMDRASGWYKLKIKPISITVSCLLVVLMNIDTIEIIDKSIHNPAALNVEVNHIAAIAPNISFNQSGDTVFLKIQDPKTGVMLNKTIVGSGATDSTLAALQQQYKDFSTITKEMNSIYQFGYPNGWSDVWQEWFHPERTRMYTGTERVMCSIGYALIKILGLAITVAALQVGSTYWFDTLNKLINLRGTGKKPADNSKK